MVVPLGAALLIVAGSGSAEQNKAAAKPPPAPPVEVKHDASPPLKTIAPKPKHARKLHEEHKIPVPPGSKTPDPVVQTSKPSLATPTLGANFEGVAVQDSAPPDTNGAAGPAHYVQIVNESFQVFTKSGTSLYGPVPTNTIWSGFGGGCENNNDGDATVEYDRLANRWIFQQFSVSTTPYLECIAVSTSGDPTGSYYRYAFSGFADEFPDYPKLGVWPDAYYVTYNLFANAQFFDGPEVCAYNRAKMLLGQSTGTGQCFVVNNLNLGGLLPSDVDSATPPPAGAPDYVMGWDTGALELWKFHVDWTTPSHSTLTGSTDIPVAAFDPACDGGDCVPQSGGETLDSLGDRLMYRLAYRNFGDHESLVVTHSVKAGSSVGVRWYEIRDPGGSPTVYQQSTYAPDSKFRWMGSAAMDGSGDIALGFSVSSSSTHPGIHYTGHLVSDAPGVMSQGEGVIKDGLGSQSNTYNRWGDYSSMSIDPSDDCTFWFTSEYIPSNGSFNWHTRIASFKLPGCAGASVDDFSMSAAPSGVTVEQGESGQTTIATAVTTGSAQSVALTASGQPTGATVSFSPSSVTAGNSSTMTIDLDPSTPVGTFPISVVGTGSSSVQSTTVNLTVKRLNAVTNGDFENGLTGWDVSGAVTPTIVAGKKEFRSGGHAAQLGTKTAVAGDSSLSQTVVVPGGSSALTFWYQPHCKAKLTDHVQAQLRTTGGATVATLLDVCTNAKKWIGVTFDTSPYAGQTLVLWFNAHGSGLKGKADYFMIDDVALGVPLGASPILNGGFETGDLGSWTPDGVVSPAVSATPHTGTWSAQLGSPTEFDGNSTLSQIVVVPGGTSTLTVWYQPHCSDTIEYDQIQVQIRTTGGTLLGTPLNVCADSNTWTKATFSMNAYQGQTVVVRLNVHDDGYPDDPTYALFDDISLS